MAFEDLDFEDTLDDEEAPPPEESGNRAFLIIAGILGAIAVFALICIAVYALVLLPGRNGGEDASRATTDAQNTEVALVVNQTSTSVAATEKAAWTPTPTDTVPPTDTPTATSTPVVAVPTTAAPTVNADTATVAALLTQAVLTQTALPTLGTLTVTPEGLPDTGFADDIGLPTMLGAAFLLIVVIFLARRLRTA